jgi:penicillin amidase
MRARFGLRLFKWLAGILLLFSILATAGGYLWWTRGLPQTSGAVTLKGLGGETRVIRDAYGVPHIFAPAMSDAMRVLGYLHAQDRMFQMDITRRVSEGRLAEIIGPDGLRFDRLFRTIDLAGHARKSLSALSPEARAQLDAYAAGVNAWLSESGQALPVEYAILGFTPEPWKPEDSILWGKAMAWKLSANWRQDALRGKLATRYERGRLERLFPKPFPEWPITIQPQIGGGATRAERGFTPNDQQKTVTHAGAGSVHERGFTPSDQQKTATSADAGSAPLSPQEAAVKATTIDYAGLLALPTIGHGASNEWVVDGSRSATGKPLLANDPHLDLGIPILWYLVRITTPELTLTGATSPGAPVVLLGQNGHIAWGFTTTESDTQDLFVETLDAEHPGHYRTPEGPRPLIEEKFDIAVKGMPPLAFLRRSTHRGPIISDILGDLNTGGQLVSLAWTGFGDADTSAEAIQKINRAKNREEFEAALRLYQSPAQNIAFAATDGTIGFVNAGDVPMRKSGDGRYPSDGATGETDWTGKVPFEGWPRLFNPPAGAIVNANNAVAPLDYPYWLGYDNHPGFRARRIVELLGERDRHDLASFAAIQMDIQAIHARDLLPFLLKLPAETPLARQTLDLLRKWDFKAAHDRPEPLILEWWLRRMNQHLLKAGLDALAPAVGGLNAASVIDILRRPDGFCNGDADCMGAVRGAFEETLRDLSGRYGEDAARWRWGDEHRALMANQVLDRVPGFKSLFNVDFASDGGYYTVNRGGNLGAVAQDQSFVRNSGAGYRGIYDLADPSRSRFIIATGQSGHPLSPHYADQLALWRRGEGIRLHVSEAELMASNKGVLSFRP